MGGGDDLGMKEYARAFYLSPAWQNCRNTYAQSVGGLCERCLRKGLYVPGEIVHHKQDVLAFLALLLQHVAHQGVVGGVQIGGGLVQQ